MENASDLLGIKLTTLLETGGNLLNEAKNDATEFIKNNLAPIGAGVGGVAIGSVLGGIAVAKSRKSSNRRRRKSKARRSRKKRYHSRKGKKLKFGSKAWRKKYSRKRRTPRTAGKGKDTSTRRIRYTKKGQPYIILHNGRARFIKNKSAKSSHKRKGGKY